MSQFCHSSDRAVQSMNVREARRPWLRVPFNVKLPFSSIPGTFAEIIRRGGGAEMVVVTFTVGRSCAFLRSAPPLAKRGAASRSSAPVEVK